MSNKKVAVITGANSGIGLSLADRLLTTHQPSLRVCLACRNQLRAEAARTRLKLRHPDADISIVLVDTSSIKSVLFAANEIKQKYSRLDYLYLNAGVMKIKSVNWRQVMMIFAGEGKRILSTGHGCLNHEDNMTAEGLQEYFATNLFGHYVMVRELEDLLVASCPAQIIWTGSQNADDSVLDFKDIQHRNGIDPYASSKYATDLISIALNDRLNQKGVYSHTACPGLVLTGMTFGILPVWVWWLMIPFLYFMRLFVKSLSCSPYNASEALVWLSKQKAESVTPRVKYRSCCSVLGSLYTEGEKLKVADEDADNLYEQLEAMYQGFKKKYTTNDIHLNSS